MSPGRRRITIGAIVLVLVSYAIAWLLHRAAIRDIEAARARIAAGDNVSALRPLDRAIWADPYAIEAYLLRATGIAAHAWMEHPRYRRYSREDALADVDRYLRYRPESGEGHYWRGVALAELGRFKPALQEYGRAIALMDDPSIALLGRARSRFFDGDRKAAIRDLTAAIERHPLVPESYEERAKCYRFTSDRRAADTDGIRATLLRHLPGLTREELERRTALLLRVRPDRHP